MKPVRFCIVTIWLCLALLISAIALSEPLEKTGRTIRVEADGSGDYPTIEEAIEQALEEDAIVLGPGLYQLAVSLKILQALHLVGAGMDQTEIISEDDGYVISFVGDGSFSAEGITFRHAGEKPADVVVISRGEVQLVGCSFNGGVGKDYGDGLVLKNETTGIVRGCTATNNEDDGISVEDHAQATLEGNLCKNNHGQGIRYDGNSRVTCRGNTCSENGLNGIRLLVSTEVTLEDNVCTDNGTAGIAMGFLTNARGVARQNECTQNQKHGIYVGGEAQVTLENNVCKENKDCGIFLSENANGVVHGNESSGNAYYGIGLRKAAQGVIEQNVCIDNKRFGIWFYENASGEARENECTGNKYGIYVASTATPKLADNNCHDNTEEDVRDEKS